MKLVIKKENTGLYNYMESRNCPLATALKNAGINSPVVRGFDETTKKAIWRGIKDGKPVQGGFTREQTITAYMLSTSKQDEDTIIEIPDYDTSDK